MLRITHRRIVPIRRDFITVFEANENHIRRKFRCRVASIDTIVNLLDGFLQDDTVHVGYTVSKRNQVYKFNCVIKINK